MGKEVYRFSPAEINGKTIIEWNAKGKSEELSKGVYHIHIQSGDTKELLPVVKR
jgi:hypothetical protein